MSKQKNMTGQIATLKKVMHYLKHYIPILILSVVLLLAALVFLLTIVTLNRRISAIQRAGIQVASLLISRESRAVYINDMEFQLTEAALAGEGVMLGIHNLVRGHLARGALVFAHPAQITSGRSNFMRINPVARQRPIVARFAEHLLRDLRGH